jgi:fatty acid desaturase
MSEKPANETGAKRRRSVGRTFAVAAAILAVVQACLTIRGRGIEGFVLWVLILFAGYWLLFTLLAWVWGKLRNRT